MDGGVERGMGMGNGNGNEIECLVVVLTFSSVLVFWKVLGSVNLSYDYGDKWVFTFYCLVLLPL